MGDGRCAGTGGLGGGRAMPATHLRAWVVLLFLCPLLSLPPPAPFMTGSHDWLSPPLPPPQAALTEGLRSTPQLAGVARRVVAQATEALLEVQLSEEAALECLRAAVPGIQRWGLVCVCGVGGG